MGSIAAAPVLALMIRRSSEKPVAKGRCGGSDSGTATTLGHAAASLLPHRLAAVGNGGGWGDGDAEDVG